MRTEILIAICGDDNKFIEQMSELLVRQNYNVKVLPWSSQVLSILKKDPVHLLALSLPGKTEPVYQLLTALRSDEKLKHLPVLAINPQGAGSEGISVLDAGADDFMSRPFNGQIFLARIRTLLRRKLWAEEKDEDATVLELGLLKIQMLSRQVSIAGKILFLTRLEFDLLTFLIKNKDQAFKRQELLEAVWNYPENIETRTLDKHVESLRRKLGSWGTSIETLHGVGYRFVWTSVTPEA